jgi:hypothetical protein
MLNPTDRSWLVAASVAAALCAIVPFASAPARGAELAASTSNDVSINLLAPVSGLLVSALAGGDVLALAAEYEHVVAPSWTVYAQPGVIVGTLFGGFALGGVLAVGGRYYFSHAALRGFWVGTELGGSFTSGLAARAWTAGLTATFGYNFVFQNRMFISVGAGLGLLAGTIRLGPTPSLRGQVGWMF